MAFGNVKVSYKPCKSVGSLKASVDYMLGKQKEQKEKGIVKTAPDLYTALGCERDNFANNILVTRKLNNKSYSRLKENEILAHKMSISFSPKDNYKLSYRKAFEIARQFAEEFAHSKGHEVLFAVHTDTKHIHAHFVISNCNIHTGRSYRRNKKDLYKMSEFLGEKCLENGLVNSARDSFYNNDLETPKEREGLAEKEIKKRGAETFKDELKEVIKIEIADPINKTLDDVVKALLKNWNVETRLKGNTISYRHPEFRDKNNNLVSVRGSKLGELFTVKGINYELTKKATRTTEYSRSNQIETARTGRTSDTANIIDTTGRSTPSIEESYDIARAKFQPNRGEITSNNLDSDIGRNEQSLDRFYDRYTKRVKDDERTADENNKPTKRVSFKGGR